MTGITELLLIMAQSNERPSFLSEAMRPPPIVTEPFVRNTHPMTIQFEPRIYSRDLLDLEPLPPRQTKWANEKTGDTLNRVNRQRQDAKDAKAKLIARMKKRG